MGTSGAAAAVLALTGLRGTLEVVKGAAPSWEVKVPGQGAPLWRLKAAGAVLRPDQASEDKLRVSEIFEISQDANTVSKAAETAEMVRAIRVVTIYRKVPQKDSP